LGILEALGEEVGGLVEVERKGTERERKTRWKVEG